MITAGLFIAAFSVYSVARLVLKYDPELEHGPDEIMSRMTLNDFVRLRHYVDDAYLGMTLALAAAAAKAHG